MSYKVGYIQRRSQSIVPDRQKEELEICGVDVVYNNLDDALAESSIRKGDTLCVWSMGIIGRVRVHEAFLAVAKAGGKGIYSLKTKKLYPSKLPAAQHIHDAIQEIKGFEDKVRTVATGEVSGRKPLLSEAQRARARDLHTDGVHIDDIAMKLKCSSSTIRRIL